MLQWGGSMVGAGLLSALLLETVLGGFSRTGASTNGGWFALIVALMCIRRSGGCCWRWAWPSGCENGRLLAKGPGTGIREQGSELRNRLEVTAP